MRRLVERLQLVPWHGFELHAEGFEFGATELFKGRTGGPSDHAVHNIIFACSSPRGARQTGVANVAPACRKPGIPDFYEFIWVGQLADKRRTT